MTDPETTTRHASLEELLARRDGEGLSPEVDRHVDRCAQCHEELERLHQARARLRALPRPTPPRDRWPAVREALVAERRAHERQRLLFLAAVAAAILLAVLVVQGALDRRALERQRNELETTIAVLMEHSQLLEAELQAVRTGNRVQSGWRAQAVVELEDMLSQIDGHLERVRDHAVDEPSQATVDLWRDRLEVQDALLRVQTEPMSHRGI